MEKATTKGPEPLLMMSLRRTTVIIPTYNRSDMVLDAVRSALGQSVPVEVVVVDDGSTDDTRGVLERFLRQEPDAPLTLVFQENRERGASRNRGAREAGREAEFLLFLDADDAIDPEHVATLMEVADRYPDAPLVTSPVLLCDEDLNPVAQAGGVRQSDSSDGTAAIALRDFVHGREVIPIGSLVRHVAFARVGGFVEDRALSGSEDWLFHARILLLGEGRRSAKATLNLRKHPGNTMANAEAMLASMLEAHRRFFHEASKTLQAPPDRWAGPSRAHLLTQASTQFYAGAFNRRARELLWRAAAEHPPVVMSRLWGWTILRSLLPVSIVSGLRRWKGR